MPGNISHRGSAWNDGEGFTGAKFILCGHSGIISRSTNGTSFTQVEPQFGSAAADDVTSYRLRDECGACPPHDEANAVGSIEKIARASGSKSGGKTQGKGLSMLTEHADTMWCRDRGTLTDSASASTARAIEG